MNLRPPETKIFLLPDLSDQVEKWRQQQQSIVFTNGCFDLLHVGHIYTLTKAAEQGDKLIVGLNTDSSVSKLKGPNRPINKELERAMVLAALEVVDAVVLFGEDTPLQLIQTLQPDVLVKGGDYQPETIIGHKEVTEKGGKVVIIPYQEGYSTTELEKRLKRG